MSLPLTLIFLTMAPIFSKRRFSLLLFVLSVNRNLCAQAKDQFRLTSIHAAEEDLGLTLPLGVVSLVETPSNDSVAHLKVGSESQQLIGHSSNERREIIVKRSLSSYNPKIPRRRPITADDKTRKYALPPNSYRGSDFPPTTDLRQAPFYPNFKVSTCLNDDDYPGFYLNDIKEYFFQSPIDCCKKYFSNSTSSCMNNATSLIKSWNFSSGQKKEQYRSSQSDNWSLPSKMPKKEQYSNSSNENIINDNSSLLKQKDPIPLKESDSPKMVRSGHNPNIAQLAAKSSKTNPMKESNYGKHLHGKSSDAWGSSSANNYPGGKYGKSSKYLKPTESNHYYFIESGKSPEYWEQIKSMHHPKYNSKSSKSSKHWKSSKSLYYYHPHYNGKSGKSSKHWKSSKSLHYYFSKSTKHSKHSKPAKSKYPKSKVYKPKGGKGLITEAPTSVPTYVLSEKPTTSPADDLDSHYPTYIPTYILSEKPTPSPADVLDTRYPTYFPTTVVIPTPLSVEPTVKPTTASPSKKPSLTTPTYSPTTSIPTYSPTTTQDVTVMPTYPPSTIFPTFSPTPEPSPSPTQISTSEPSSSPTQISTSPMPTYLPTPPTTDKPPTPFPLEVSNLPTFSPTFSPTVDKDQPTNEPTPYSTQMAGMDLCVWGNPESSGQRSSEYLLVPRNANKVVIDASSGSKYSVIIEPDGVASTAGFIKSLEDYHGHLGLRPQDLSQGENEFQPITRVFDLDNGGVTNAPRFMEAFAGVESSPDSGVIHTILLDRQGRAWATGGNEFGQLCLGDTIDRLIPEMILVDGRIVDVAIGGGHTLLLDEHGNVHGCGSNEFGQLGLEKIKQTNIPTRLESLGSVRTVSSGRFHSLFMTNSGIFVTGSNYFGQLCQPTNVEQVFSPRELDIPPNTVVSFEAIKSSSFILYDDGKVNGCGRNDFGQLGDGTNRMKVVTVVELDKVVRLLGNGPSAESAFFVAVDGSVFGTGLNDRGQLGVGDLKDRNIPTAVQFGQDVLISVLSAAEDHTLSMKEVADTLAPTPSVSSTPPTLSPTNLLTDEPTFSPTLFPTPSSTTYDPTVSSTYSPTRESQDFFFWGDPGAVGQESKADVETPIEVGADVISSAAGSRYTMIVVNDGSAVSGGFIESMDNYRGHLGVDVENVSQGVNAFQPISQVYTSNEGITKSAPAFDRVYGGVESSPGSGVIHSILLDQQGRAYATGSNNKGQLCLSDNKDRFIPEKVPIDGRIVDVAIGGEHTLLLDESGNVYGCGSNEFGQLGLKISQTNNPIRLDNLESVSSISSGLAHSVFMTADGLYATGSNEFDQLCRNTRGNDVLRPSQLDFDITNVKSFEAIKSSSYILSSDGSVNGCGRNDYGQLGDGTNQEGIFTTVELDEVVRLVGVGPSAESVFFVAADETVWGTGLNDNGQLGVSDLLNRNVPTRVEFPGEVLLSSLSAAESHSVALGIITATFAPTPFVTSYPPSTYPPTKESQNFYFWGAPESIGQESSVDVEQPILLDDNVIMGAAGSRYTLAVLSDGSTLSGGFIKSINDYRGHLGVNMENLTQGHNKLQPVTHVVNAAGNLINAPIFVQVYGGVENSPGSSVIHSILIDRQGKVYATGSNNRGQLCLSDNEDRFIPEQIPADGRIVDVAIGGEHTLLLDEFGNVYGCGSNELGQLGLQGSTPETNSPMWVDKLESVSSVSAGLDHSVFMAADGIYVTGGNEFGQLCLNTRGNDVQRPRRLELDISNVRSFEAIKSSSYILSSDGTVLSCGRNKFGQLGDGTNQEGIFSLVDLDEVVRLVGVGPSAESVFFVTADETVWGTGLNDNGQLGVSDLLNRNVPTRVNFPGEIILSSLSAAEDHTVAVGLPTGTFTPTYAPTIETTDLPTQEGKDIYFWGAPESVGQESLVDAKQPIFLDDNIVMGAAGSRYTIVILSDGSTLAGGFIESINIYRGHFGINTDNLAQGDNKFQFVTHVVNAAGDLVDAPSFHQVYGGVENSPGSGVIHSILIDRQGRAFATGSNNKGQLCLSDNEDRFIPEQIPIDGRIVDVAIGGEHTLLLDEFGNAHGCGSNELGQLGLGGSTRQTRIPLRLDRLDSVTSVSSGIDHSVFMTADGIYVSGSNSVGQLCVNNTEVQNLLIPGFLNIPIENIKQFEAVKFSSLILYVDGSVNGCGRNDYGQLGDGTNQEGIFTTVELDEVVRLVGVGPSSESTFYVSEDERVWGTGLNDRGQLGVSDLLNKNVPTRVQFFSRIVLNSLSAAEDHTIAWGTTVGTFAPTPSTTTIPPTTVGINAPTSAPTYTPTYVPTLAPIPSSTLEPSSATSLPTRESQNLFFWGAPESVGEVISIDVSYPLELDDDVIYAAAGSRYSLIVLQDGSALSAGFVEELDGYNGFLGIDAENVSRGGNEFRRISVVYDANEGTTTNAPRFDQVYAGVESSPGSGVIHSILLDRQGRAWATGSNSKGQLCLGGNEDRFIPEQIPIDGRIVDVAIGGEHTLLLDEFGNVYGCGSNELGQLGIGSDTISISFPLVIDVLNSVSGVSAGRDHSLFMTEDGIFVTGSNDFGQLCADTDGQNLVLPSLLDIPVNQVSMFEAIAFSSYILFIDGTVSSCGKNSYGQLGDGTNQDRIFSLVDLDNIVLLLGVGPSAESIFFVSADERVWGTGLNDRGQLGVGDFKNRNVPTFVKFPGEVQLSVLSAAGDHTVAVGMITGSLPPTVVPLTDPPTPPTLVSSSPTYSPTYVPTESPTFETIESEPTYVPTLSPFSTEIDPTTHPTNVPSMGPTSLAEVFPTSSPILGTSSPTTYFPTTSPPTFLVENTELYFWGAPESVGGTSAEDYFSPRNGNKVVRDVAAGSKYSIVVLEDGTAQSAGFINSLDNYHGHLGLRGSDVVQGENAFQDITSVFDAENDMVIDAPVFTRAYAGADQISSPGSIHTVLIDEGGQVWTTGSNEKGQLCLGDFEDRLIPTKVALNERVSRAAVGGEHTILLLEDGSVLGCGSNEVGQLGLTSSVTEVNSPTTIDGVGVVESISAGLGFSLFVTSTGLQVTGNNFYGQLCVDTSGADLLSPIAIDDVDSSIVASFEAIQTSSYILFRDGSVGACGRNNFGQLGDGSNIDQIRTVALVPNPITKLGVGPSSESAFFIDGDGVAYGTGLNDRGQLGVGDDQNRNELTMVQFEGVYVQHLSAADDHTLSL